MKKYIILTALLGLSTLLNAQTLTDYDGNNYPYVQIGNQIWMAENLKVTHYPNGTPIPLVTDYTAWSNLGDNNTDDAYCFYNNDEVISYGALYTWAAAMGDNAVSSNTNPSGVQGVCPDGWHLPSTEEWNELIAFLASEGYSGQEGHALKSVTDWNENGNGADLYGFNGLPGGLREPINGLFYWGGSYGYWWSSTEPDEQNAFLSDLAYDRNSINYAYSEKSLGLSVRCLKDEPNLVASYPFNGNANDESGNGNNGFVDGATLSPDRFGNADKAYSFDGVDDYILIMDPIPDKLQIQNEITLSAWIKLSQYPTEMGLIAGSQNDQTASGASIFIDNRENPDGHNAPAGHIHFQIGDGSWHHSNTATVVPLNQWTLITATRKANEDAKIYFNGILQTSESVGWAGNISYSDCWFAIGKQKDLNRMFPGNIDDVKVYNRALSAEEIRQVYQNFHAPKNLSATSGNGQVTLKWSSEGIENIQSYQIYMDGTFVDNLNVSSSSDTSYVVSGLSNYQSYQFHITSTDNYNKVSQSSDTVRSIPSTKSLIAYWTFNEDNANDSENSNHGTIVGSSTTFTDGKVGRAITFSGSGNDYIEIPGFNLPVISVEAWVNSAKFGYYTSMVTKKYAASGWNDPYTSWSLWGHENTNYPGFISQMREIHAGSAMPTGEWFHMAFTFDGYTVKLYVNGINQATGILESGINISDGNIYIGKPKDSNHSFIGSIDEVAIWDYALSDEEITKHYQNGAYGFSYTAIKPSATTLDKTNLTSASVTMNGIVKPNEVETFVNFEWGTDPELLSYNSTTAESVGAGKESVPVIQGLAGLSENTTYYYRIVASNVLGTTKGEILSFTTFASGTETLNDYDGNTYPAVQIGNQIWMAENLKVTHYPDGTPIPLVTGDSDWANLGDNTTDDAYCFYNNDAANSYGAMYTWAAAMGDNAVSSNANPSDVQGVCPDGYHLPSKAEWDELIAFIASEGYSGQEGSVLKSTSNWYNDGFGSNLYGFNALPAGNRIHNTGAFFGQTEFTQFWSSTEGALSINANSNKFSYAFSYVEQNDYAKSNAYSVRCVKNSTNTTNGLLASYPFNGNANDESGNAYHGTVFGPTLTNDRFKNNEQAFLFSSQDKIVIGESMNFLGGKSEASFLAWIKPHTQGQELCIASAENQFNFAVNAQNKAMLITNINGIVNSIESVNTIPENKWTMVCGIFTGSELQLYVNGNLETSTPQSGIFNEYYGQFLLGINGTNFGFTGVLDDIRFYSRALTNTEINNMYKEEAVIFFDEQNYVSFPGLGASSASWGDANNDGNLDLALSGSQQEVQFAALYLNDGNNGFSEHSGIALNGAELGSLSWGDYNKDGNLDLLSSGYTSSYGRTTKLYRNSNNGTFTEQNQFTLEPYEAPTSDWGDFDNDGDLDLLISGRDNSGNCTAKIYQNNGIEGFIELENISLTGIFTGKVSWGDYDNDGDLDILIVGSTWTSGNTCKIYQNNGNQNFEELTAVSFIGLKEGSANWGDLDNDGDLDIFIIGRNDQGIFSVVYENNGNQTFTEASGAGLLGLASSSSFLGDIDNDGDLDIVISGISAASNISAKIYLNKGNFVFEEQTEMFMNGAYNSSINLCDYDNDGDLDLFLTGNSTSNQIISHLYKNNAANIGRTNFAPGQASGLTQNVSKNRVHLSWEAANDDHSPSVSLSYNVFVRTETDTIVMPHADLQSGQLKTPELGNAQLNQFYILKNLEPGTYYWKVQAIDQSYKGGAWSEEQSFVIDYNPDETLIDIDGNLYSYVQIGSQTWMAENLKVSRYPNGTHIPLVTDNTAWTNLGDNNTDDAYCYIQNDPINTNGYLYTWAAAMGDNAISSNTNPSDVQGVCPDGWHLPSKSEWEVLIAYLAEQGYAGQESAVLKSLSGWEDNQNGSNLVGFNALPSGYRDCENLGEYINSGTNADWWTSTESELLTIKAFDFYIEGINGINIPESKKSYGVAVRCVKDKEVSALLAHYPLNGSTIDASGNMHHALIFDQSNNTAGLNTSAGRYGDENTAYQFENDGKYMKIEHSGNWNTRSDFSANIWVKLNELPANGLGDCLLKDDTGRSLLIGPEGNVIYHYEGSDLTWLSPTTQNGLIVPDTWYMISYSISASDTLKIYVNGNLKVNQHIQQSESISNNYFIASNDYYDFERFLNGSVDEVSIYQKEISTIEIDSLYKNYNPVSTFTASAEYGYNVLFWTNEESNEININHYNIYKNGAFHKHVFNQFEFYDLMVISGQVYTYFVTSVDKNGYESAPSETIQLTAQSFESTNVTLSVNMSRQIQLGLFDINNDYVDVMGNFSNWENPIQLNYMGDSIYQIRIENQPLNRQLEYKFRKNGSWESGSHELEGYPNRSLNLAFSTNYSNHWYDNLDPDRKLSQPIADFRFDQNYNDYSEYNNHPENYAVSLTNDRFSVENQALNVYGSGSFMEIPEPLAEINPQGELSISFWMKPSTDPGNFQYLISEYHDTSFNYQIYFKDAKIHMNCWDNSSMQYTLSSTETYPVQTNEWTFVSFVYEQNILKLYINGVFNSSINIAGSIFVSPTNSYLGDRYQDGTNYYNGALDELKFYNRALRDNELAALYSNFHAPKNLQAQQFDNYIQLSWNDPKISQLSKFNIYRNNQKIGEVYTNSETPTSYYDYSIVAGNTYTYYITSTDAYSNESAPSENVFINYGATMDLFFSEYGEGSANNKYIEIYNPTDQTIDLSNYGFPSVSNGPTVAGRFEFWNVFNAGSSIAPQSVFVIAHSGANEFILQRANMTFDYLGNGDDGFALAKIIDNGTSVDTFYLDWIGNFNEYPSVGWSVAGINEATANHTIRRKKSINQGNSWANSAGTDFFNSEWYVLAMDDFSDLGSHNHGTENNILEFSIEGMVSSSINQIDKEIYVTVPLGSDQSNLTASFVLSNFAFAQVNENNQLSGISTNDFSNPVIYKIIAENGTSKEYTVMITEVLSGEKDILSFTIANQIGESIIDNANNTVNITMPSGSDLSNLIPEIEVSPGAAISPASGVAQNFNATVLYTVTAQDASSKTWSINVSNESIPNVRIYDIQFTENEDGNSPFNGQKVQTSGTVTGIGNGQVFIQDGESAWNGIYIYDSGNANTYQLSIGDNISIIAWVQEYYGLTELYNIEQLTVHSSGNTVNPISNSTADLNSESMESLLVLISNAQVTDLPNEENHNVYTLDDGSGSLQVGQSFFDFSLTLGNYYDITGIMKENYNKYVLQPRNLNDISEITSNNGILNLSLRSVYTSAIINNVALRIFKNDVFVEEVSIASAYNYQKEMEAGTYTIIFFAPSTIVYKKEIIISSGQTNNYNFYMGMLGDFNHDQSINYYDFDILAQFWYSNDYTMEIGPATGQLPNAMVDADYVVDFEDLMIFTMMWNIYNKSASIDFGTIGNKADKTLFSLENKSTRTDVYLENLDEIRSIQIKLKVDVETNPEELKLILPHKNAVILKRVDSDQHVLEINLAFLGEKSVENLLLSIENSTNFEIQGLEFIYFKTNNEQEEGFIETNAFEEISLYPNPVKAGDVLQLSVNETDNIQSVKIYHISGKLIQSIQTSEVKNIATDKLSPGLYLIEIKKDQASRRIKFIVY